MTALARLAAAHGVATDHAPSPGRRVEVPPDTLVAVLAALDVDASTPGAVAAALERHAAGAPLLPPTVVWPAGRTAPEALRALPPGTALRLETPAGEPLRWGADASHAPGTPAAPPPPGHYLLRARTPDGRAARATLLAAPARVPEPSGRGFGLLVQLYSVLSARSWGMGDLGDLADLASWAGHALGADFLQLNPLHAAVPGRAGEPTDPSPYRPASRRFADPVHLRIEDVPEYGYLEPAARARVSALLARAAELRRAVLDKGVPIDRDAVWALKRQALELLRGVALSPGRRAAYHAFRAARGPALEDHATWCALAELHGPDWRRWPPALRDPRSAATRRARHDHLERVDFHRWLCWLADGQLARAQRVAEAAGMSVGLVHDLALGVHPQGSDAWAEQDVLARGVSLGAPPDAFNPHGQDWGLPPWRPDALAARGYAPYREVLAGLLRHAGGVRVDHVMGQFRQWWVPAGASPREGTYVAYDAEAMLAVLTAEAHRAGAVVIGEDLGTVAAGVRAELAERGVLGTSVLWFERDEERPGHPPRPPQRWRADCLATLTTHDLPPTAARLTAEHVALRERLGLLAGESGRSSAAEAERAEAQRESAAWLELFARLGLLPRDAGEEERIAAAYRFLARTPARLVGVWLPDAVGDRRPQNLPGTTAGAYPNWRLPVADGAGRPVALEELTAAERVAALFRAVREELR